MKKFTIVWTENKSIQVEADSEEEAREKFNYGNIDWASAEYHESEIVEVYEFKPL
jgi:hypothetical protein